MSGVTQAPAVPAAQRRRREEAAGDREWRAGSRSPRPGPAAASSATDSLADAYRAFNSASSRRRPAWPFALFYLIGWRGQRILPGEARGVLEMIRFLAMYTCAHTLAHTPTHSCHTRAIHPCARTLHSDTTPSNTRTLNTIHAHAK